MRAGCPGAGESTCYFAIQIAKRSAGPDFLILRDGQSRHAAGALPFAQKLAVCIEDFNPLVVAIGDVDPAPGIDHEVVRKAELAGTGSAFAELEEILPVT